MYMIFNKENGSVHMMTDVLPNEGMRDDAVYAIVERDWSDIDATHVYEYVDGEVVDQGEQVIDQVELARMEQEVADNAYKNSRAMLYPKLEDQLDKIFHEGIDAWKADIQAVKDAHPKPD